MSPPSLEKLIVKIIPSRSKSTLIFQSENLTTQKGLQTDSKQSLPNFQKLEDSCQNSCDRKKIWETLGQSPLVIDYNNQEKIISIYYDVRDFFPSEVEVTVNEKILNVTAMHRKDCPTCKNAVLKLSSTVPLPYCLDPESLQACISDDGLLSIQGYIKKSEQTKFDESTSSKYLLRSSQFSSEDMQKAELTECDSESEDVRDCDDVEDSEGIQDSEGVQDSDCPQDSEGLLDSENLQSTECLSNRNKAADEVIIIQYPQFHTSPPRFN